MDPYTNYFYDHREKIYYLNKQGAELIGSELTPPTKNRNYTHVLMRNDLYIHFGTPKDWIPEHPIKLIEEGKTRLVRPDVFFQVKGQKYFGEIDNTQKMSENMAKIKDYEKLKAAGAYKIFPKLVWLTTTELRRERLFKACKDHSLESEIFLVSEIR